MAKSVGTIHSWREIPIPYRCEGCPYPKVVSSVTGRMEAACAPMYRKLKRGRRQKARDKFVGFGYRILIWKTVCCWVGKEESTISIVDQSERRKRNEKTFESNHL